LAAKKQAEVAMLKGAERAAGPRRDRCCRGLAGRGFGFNCALDGYRSPKEV